MRLVLVEWIDSFGCSPNWGVIEDDPKPPTIPVCQSVGWLAYDGDDCKVVVPHIADATDYSKRQGCGEMTIPSRTIIRLVDLAIPKASAAA
jgi:hypothetical protein